MYIYIIFTYYTYTHTHAHTHTHTIGGGKENRSSSCLIKKYYNSMDPVEILIRQLGVVSITIGC